MKLASVIMAPLYFAATGLLLIWGGWLLLTRDPDGGRHPEGAVMFVVAVLCAVLGLVSVRRSRRHRSERGSG